MGKLDAMKEWLQSISQAFKKEIDAVDEPDYNDIYNAGIIMLGGNITRAPETVIIDGKEVMTEIVTFESKGCNGEESVRAKAIDAFKDIAIKAFDNQRNAGFLKTAGSVAVAIIGTISMTVLFLAIIALFE